MTSTNLFFLPRKELRFYNLPSYGIIIALKTMCGGELISSMPFPLSASLSITQHALRGNESNLSKKLGNNCLIIQVPRSTLSLSLCGGASSSCRPPHPTSTQPRTHLPRSISLSLLAPQTICHGSDETICHGLVHLNVCVIVEAVTGKA